MIVKSSGASEPGAINFDRDRLAFAAAHFLRNLLAGPLARVLAVHFKYAIAVAKSQPSGGRAFHRRLDIHAVAMLNDGYANAVKTRVLIFLQLLEFVVREIHRVGIER